MAVINTNVKALHTQYALKNSARAQTVAMEQLSTGKRINSARDDAAGMAIAKRMSQQIRSLDMAIRNAGDAVALIQTAEGATGTITDMLQRMRELAIQSLNDTNSQDQRGYLDLEFQQLKQQIVTISEHTQWNGFSILNGSVGERVGERPVFRVTSQPAFYNDAQITLGGIQAGDMIINGVTIRSALPLDGAINGIEPKPTSAAPGSAIAIAKAINEATELTGVAAVVNKNTMQGTSMSGTVQSGYIEINGFRTGDLTTLLNNPRVTREEVVAAINVISEQTGVVAIDTNNDKLGIRLEAADGRNISVELKPTATGATAITDFASALGLRQGLQVGTYSLETTVEGKLNITSSGDWTRAGIAPATADDKFNYNQNISIAQTSLRPIAAAAGDAVVLQRGDLVINGVEIRGTIDSDDKSTYAPTASSNRLGSAIAIATAINASSEETGVRAVANPTVISGQVVDTAGLAGTNLPGGAVDYTFYINGSAVNVTHAGEGDETWLNKLADAINTQLPYIQVKAVAGQNGLNITATDGRNLSVWFDTTTAPALTAANLGLAVTGSTTTPVPGVTGATPAGATFTAASTVYGTVSLFSDKAFSIEPGFNGYTSASNFTKLGFNEGTFGGTVNEADSKMTPPRTGRLTFHVGASATQTIQIDFADYGAKGPITGEITGDVENWNNDKRVNRIDNAESARSILGKIDTALDKVNGNRAVMGAVMNRLDYIMENLANVSMNTSASRSQIEDADYAKASTELARTGIMQQAATAILAQANMDQQTVLKLLG